MVLAGTVRSTKCAVLLVAAVFFAAVLIGIGLRPLSSVGSPPRASHSTKPAAPSTADGPPAPPPPPQAEPFTEKTASQYAAELRNFYLKKLWKPSIPPFSIKYRPFGAFDWTLPAPPRWTQPMGESLCIIDLDNRPLNQRGQIFGPTPMSWDDPLHVHGLSLGLLNHWLYARIHGYKYYYVAVDAPFDRRASWKKPPILAKILREHHVCVYMDSDALFHRLDLPFEWLLNYWQLYPETNSLALSSDPDLDGNRDRFGRLYLNTGFIIAQNNPTTYDILSAWEMCPDEGEPYPECVEFRTNAPGLPTDQGGFGTYVRYNFTQSIRELPCIEANGFPESDSGCKGQFIRHLWTGKHDQIKIDVGEQLPGPYMQMFHEHFREQLKTFYMTERDLMSKGPRAAARKPQPEQAQPEQAQPEKAQPEQPQPKKPLAESPPGAKLP